MPEKPKKPKPAVLPSAGRELDALFAETVLGWTVQRDTDPLRTTKPGGATIELPAFSSDETAMALGMKELLRRNWKSEVGTRTVSADGKPDRTVWHCHVWGKRGSADVEAATAPEAFARAAVQAAEAAARFVK